jgi:hypothetical protein
MRFQALARRWPPRWLPASPIRRLSAQDGISPPGSDRWRTRTRAAARPNSAISASKAIAICAAGSRRVIRYAKIHGSGQRAWLTALLARRPTKVAAIALANKLARMAWAMMAKGERYKEPVALAA